MSVSIGSRGRVRCSASFELPLTARQAWGQIRDVGQYAVHDPFHSGITIAGNVPRAGAALTLTHRYGPFRLQRVGRILRWKECDEREAGFAFSDLSRRGNGAGFPHLFSIHVAAAATHRCIVTITVNGKWTMPIPRTLARFWLLWVFVPTVHRTRNRLIAFAAMLADIERGTKR